MIYKDELYDTVDEVSCLEFIFLALLYVIGEKIRPGIPRPRC
jgi:hypothetical protein